MEVVTKQIKVYDFKELSEEVQEEIINDFVNIIAENTNFEKLDKRTNLYKAYKKCEELRTPWFLGQFIWEYDKKNILKMCKSYKYLKNGEVYCEEE